MMSDHTCSEECVSRSTRKMVHPVTLLLTTLALYFTWNWASCSQNAGTTYCYFEGIVLIAVTFGSLSLIMFWLTGLVMLAMNLIDDLMDNHAAINAYAKAKWLQMQLDIDRARFQINK